MINKIKTFFKKLSGGAAAAIDDSEKPILPISYKGFNVFYSEGTSLIERIKKTGDYEPEVTACIISELANHSNPQIIDIGANIGLISTSLLSAKNGATIFAFEPGPHQHKLLKKTIAENKLEQKILLSDLALSNKKGEEKFRIHSTGDASGDGFVDTERAGPTKTITVQTDTLDNWWIAANKPAIDFIKMDTEGSEYYILQGAQQFLKTLKPKMLIEINSQNIKNYPFTLEDLLKLIDQLGYDVYSLEKEKIDAGNREIHFKKNDTFLLLPVKQVY